MKEVTICFSFSGKVGQTPKFMELLDTLNGLFGLGEVGTEKLTTALKSVYSLLQLEQERMSMLTIKSPTLCTCWRANRPDDLEAKNTTHAKGDKP